MKREAEHTAVAAVVVVVVSVQPFAACKSAAMKSIDLLEIAAMAANIGETMAV